jgi:predicted O-methyltransferase YrrM
MNEMIPDPKSYFARLKPQRSDLLQRLESQAEAENIPIVGPVVGELLYLLTRISQPRKVLELGTATGYSAIYLAAACRQVGGQLTTLESDPTLTDQAQTHLKEAQVADVARVVCTDALDWLARTTERFDMVFMDIEKEDYLPALPLCQRALVQGGLLVADNVGFKDADPFNRAIFSDPVWRPVSLFAHLPGHSPLHDGLCLALKTA